MQTVLKNLEGFYIINIDHSENLFVYHKSRRLTKMEEKEVLLTQEGYEKLEKELEYLVTEKRGEIADRIKVALGFGDLSENSEYDEEKVHKQQMKLK